MPSVDWLSASLNTAPGSASMCMCDAIRNAICLLVLARLVTTVAGTTLYCPAGTVTLFRGAVTLMAARIAAVLSVAPAGRPCNVRMSPVEVVVQSA